MHQLGSRLKQLRKSRGWTQKQLAEQIHKSAAAIGSYEQDVQIPPTDVLISLAKLYHLSVDELLGLGRETSLSLDGLNQSQREIIEILLNEYKKPSGDNGELSAQQIKILNQIIRTFLDV